MGTTSCCFGQETFCGGNDESEKDVRGRIHTMSCANARRNDQKVLHENIFPKLWRDHARHHADTTDMGTSCPPFWVPTKRQDRHAKKLQVLGVFDQVRMCAEADRHRLCCEAPWPAGADMHRIGRCFSEDLHATCRNSFDIF